MSVYCKLTTVTLTQYVPILSEVTHAHVIAVLRETALIAKVGKKCVAKNQTWSTRTRTGMRVQNFGPIGLPAPVFEYKISDPLLTRIHGLEPVPMPIPHAPIPITWCHVGLALIPVPMDSYPHPYLYPWAGTLTQCQNLRKYNYGEPCNQMMTLYRKFYDMNVPPLNGMFINRLLHC